MKTPKEFRAYCFGSFTGAFKVSSGTVGDVEAVMVLTLIFLKQRTVEILFRINIT